MSRTDGFFPAAQGSRDAMLTWLYAEDAWATVRGTTTTTSDLDRMLELGRARRPSERTPIRVPMSLANVPARVPLAEIDVDHGDDRTTLRFAACGMIDIGGACPTASSTPNGWGCRYGRPMATTDTSTTEKQFLEDRRQGRRLRQSLDRSRRAGSERRARRVRALGTRGTKPTTQLEHILATVEWAPDPGNDATWRAVTDWAK